MITNVIEQSLRSVQRKELESKFRDFLSDEAIDASEMDLRRGAEAVTEFYRRSRFQLCDLEQDGDMLLYQWGVNDWGDGEFFDIDFTRQLIDCSDEDRRITQVSLRFRYPVVRDCSGLKAGNFWCEHVDLTNRFEDDVQTSESFRLGKRLTPDKIDIRTTMDR